MSLRAEYSWTLEYKPEVGWSLWVTWIHSHHPVKGMIMPKGLVESDDWLEVCEREANLLISSHMEKVTRMLDTPVEPSEQADELAHRGDRLQQEEADQS